MNAHQEISFRATSNVSYFESKTKPKFLESVTTNPVYAMEWADSFMKDAALASVWAQVGFYLTKTDDVEMIAKELHDRIISAYTPSSTSRCSNAMNLMVQEANREVYREIDSLIKIKRTK